MNLSRTQAIQFSAYQRPDILTSRLNQSNFDQHHESTSSHLKKRKIELPGTENDFETELEHAAQVLEALCSHSFQ